MNFDEYQSAAKKTAMYPDDTAIIYPTLGLSGEAGEVIEKVMSALMNTLTMVVRVGRISERVKKVLRDGDGIVRSDQVEELSKELGDVLWYLTALASDLNLNLSDIARENIEKLTSRQDRGTLGGSGDNR